MYKIKNQQRRTTSFQQLQGIAKKLSSLLKQGSTLEQTAICATLTKIRSEIGKAGFAMMFNLKLNFFANYSVVIQAILSRIDTTSERLVKMMRKAEAPAPLV